MGLCVCSAAMESRATPAQKRATGIAHAFTMDALFIYVFPIVHIKHLKHKIRL